MAIYSYTAVDKAGKRHEGELEAASENAVNQLITRQNMRAVVIKKKAGKSGQIAFLTSQKVKLKDLVIFTRQLATMIDAGVPLVRSLATLQNQSESEVFKKHIQEISKDVESGLSFADALEKHNRIFSPIYVNMVRAGEAGGILDDILKKLAIQQEKDARIRGKFKSAMTYPTVLVSITFLVFIGLMTVVVPKIAVIIGNLAGGKLPPLTQAMLNISNVITHFWYIHIGIIVGGYGLFT
jgi:type IV pilus assembly protein PilC